MTNITNKKYIALFIIILICVIYLISHYYFKNIEYYSQIVNKSKIPDYTRWILSDKYVSKEYAKLHGFKQQKHFNWSISVPTDFNKLPESYVIKPLIYVIHTVCILLKIITFKKIFN